VCTLTVGKKKNQGRFRYVGSDHSLVSWVQSIELVPISGDRDGDGIQSPKRGVLKDKQDILDKDDG
jgi:hypothetical protein